MEGENGEEPKRLQEAHHRKTPSQLFLESLENDERNIHCNFPYSRSRDTELPTGLIKQTEDQIGNHFQKTPVVLQDGDGKESLQSCANISAFDAEVQGKGEEQLGSNFKIEMLSQNMPTDKQGDVVEQGSASLHGIHMIHVYECETDMETDTLHQDSNTQSSTETKPNAVTDSENVFGSFSKDVHNVHGETHHLKQHHNTNESSTCTLEAEYVSQFCQQNNSQKSLQENAQSIDMTIAENVVQSANESVFNYEEESAPVKQEQDKSVPQIITEANVNNGIENEDKVCSSSDSVRTGTSTVSDNKSMCTNHIGNDKPPVLYISNTENSPGNPQLYEKPPLLDACDKYKGQKEMILSIESVQSAAGGGQTSYTLLIENTPDEGVDAEASEFAVEYVSENVNQLPVEASVEYIGQSVVRTEEETVINFNVTDTDVIEIDAFEFTGEDESVPRHYGRRKTKPATPKRCLPPRTKLSNKKKKEFSEGEKAHTTHVLDVSKIVLFSDDHDVDDSDDIHECNSCNQLFSSLKLLAEHYEAEHGEQKPYVCNVCGKCFKTNSLMKSHVRTHTAEEDKPFKCDTCGRGFSRNSRLKNHIRVHTGEKPYKCNLCQLMFRTSALRRSHMENHVDDQPYKCYACGEKFQRRHALRLHAREHEGSDPFQCDICMLSFPTNYACAVHTEKHSSAPKFKCALCTDIFETALELKHHRREDHIADMPYKCEQCDKGFFTISTLKMHSIVHNRDRKAKCEICGDLFTTDVHLQAHKLRHKDDKLFKCNLCHESFKHGGALKQHKKTHSDFACSVCGKTFPIMSRLNAHMKLVHAQDRPFSCGVCNKSFKLMFILERHMTTHSDRGRPFSCQVCKKAFMTRYHLNEHMRIHSTERPFECPVCLKSFCRTNNLNSHMKLHLKQKVYPHYSKPCQKDEKKDLASHELTHVKEKALQYEDGNECMELSDNRNKACPASEIQVRKYGVRTRKNKEKKYPKENLKKKQDRQNFKEKSTVSQLNKVSTVDEVITESSYIEVSGVQGFDKKLEDAGTDDKAGLVPKPGERSHQCKTCGEYYGTARTLSKHERSHSDKITKVWETWIELNKPKRKV